MATPKSTRTALSSQSNPTIGLEIDRIANALVLIADAMDEITDMGGKGLEGNAALGFANIVRMCGENLHALMPASPSGTKKGEGR